MSIDDCNEGPLSDRWERADPYERYVGRWSRRAAPLFLAWLQIPPGQRWLDVGCGTGALAAAIYDHCAPQHVSCVEPSEGFLDAARARLPAQAWLRRGSATELPLKNGAVDVAVSGLVLNFVAHVEAALVEMARVTRSWGTVAAYVWDYAGKMEMMRRFWEAAVELNPRAASLHEGVRFPLCTEEALRHQFEHSGLIAVETAALDFTTPFESFDDYWSPFLGGQGPAPSYAMSIDAVTRGRLRDRIRERMPAREDGSFELEARVWAVRGTVR